MLQEQTLGKSFMHLMTLHFHSKCLMVKEYFILSQFTYLELTFVAANK